MSLLQHLQSHIRKVVAGIAEREFGVDSPDVSKVLVEVPQAAQHGDVSTNAAMVMAKSLHVAPRVFAQKLAENLSSMDQVSSVEVAGAGFVNLSLKPEVWSEELRTILKDGRSYAQAHLGQGRTIHIEFVSANPTGPMHTGHVRNAVYGDVLASLYEKVGYHVYREYYVNDAGSQVDCLARSVYLRYLEALGRPLPPDAFQGDVYPGEYLIPVGQKLAQRDGEIWVHKGEKEWLPELKKFAIRSMMDLIRQDLKNLGITMDYYASEKEIVEGGSFRRPLISSATEETSIRALLHPLKANSQMIGKNVRKRFSALRNMVMKSTALYRNPTVHGHILLGTLPIIWINFNEVSLTLLTFWVPTTVVTLRVLKLL